MRERKKVEALFAELKDIIKLRRFRLRRLRNVKEQTLMAATAEPSTTDPLHRAGVGAVLAQSSGSRNGATGVSDGFRTFFNNHGRFQDEADVQQLRAMPHAKRRAVVTCFSNYRRRAKERNSRWG